MLQGCENTQIFCFENYKDYSESRIQLNILKTH